MRAGGMQAEDARTPLADGTLVKTPSAPMPPRRSQPRLRGSPSPADTCHVTRQSAAPPARGSQPRRHVPRRATIQTAPPARRSRQSPGRGFFYILLLCPREYRRVDAKM